MKEKRDNSSGAKRLATGWVCVFLMVWLPLAAVVTGNNFLFLTLSMLIGFVGLSNWLSKRNLRGIEVKRILDHEIFAETPFEIKYQITTKANHPESLNFTITEPSLMKPILEGAHVPYVKTGETIEAMNTAKLPRRGRVSLKEPIIVSNFPFGLANRWRSVGDPMEIVVFPRVEQIDDIFAQQLGDPGAKEEKKALFGSIPNTFREYVPGDPYKHIQWKISARLGKLHIKELAEEYSGQITVRVESDPTEQTLSKAASLVCHLWDKGIPMALEGPDFRIGPDNGLEFKHKLLTILALWEDRPKLHNDMAYYDAHQVIDIDPGGAITLNSSGDRDHDAA